MWSTEVALWLVLACGSLLEGEVVIVGFAVLSAGPRFPLGPVAVGLAGIVGTMAGDQAVYWIGRLVQDPYRFTFRGRPVLGEERVRTLEHFFSEHGRKTVFFLRYAFGLRTVGYFFAGAMKMRWSRFAASDLLGTASWVSLLVLLGYLVGRPVLRAVEEGWGLAVAIPVTALLVGLIIWFQRRLER